MSDRTDHAAEARGLLRWLEKWQGEEGSTDATNIACALMAQAHATAALVEQQRIANLIALGYGHTSPSGDVMGEARRALVERTGADRHQLRPDVAAALGIEVQP